MKRTTIIKFARRDENGYNALDISRQYHLEHFVGDTLAIMLCQCDCFLRGLTMCKVKMDSYEVLARRTIEYLVVEITHYLVC